MGDSLVWKGSKTAITAEQGTPVKSPRKKPDSMGSGRRSQKHTQVGALSRERRSGREALRRERLEKSDSGNVRIDPRGARITFSQDDHERHNIAPGKEIVTHR
jgi:hypothetical protein